jgi:hypothetical protein
MKAKEPVGRVEGRTNGAVVGRRDEPGTARKPLLLVDIDGVISLFGAPVGALGGAVAAGAAEPVEGSFHSIEGIPHFLSATAAAHLLALEKLYELVWASGWEERANEHLPHLLGMPPQLPFLRFERAVGGRSRHSTAHWKLAAIDEFAGERPLAWVDDALNEACEEWAAARPAATLLVRTEPEAGLTTREARVLEAWALELPAAAPE